MSIDIASPGGSEASLKAALRALTGNGEELINRYLTASDGGKTWSSIPQTYDALILRIWGRTVHTSDNDEMRIRLNSDSAGNYEWTRAGSATGSAFQSGQTAVSSAVVGFTAANNSSAGFPGFTELVIPKYAETTFKKVGWGRFVGKGGSGSTYAGEVAFSWNNTAAITSLQLLTGSGALFVNDTIFELVGVNY
jgi:hypothetical protein